MRVSDSSLKGSAEDPTLVELLQLRQLVDASPVPTYIKDRDGRVVFANLTLCERLGLPRSEVQGKTTRELWPDYAETLEANDERVLATAESVVAEEMVVQPDGLHVFMTSKFPIRDEAGEVAAVAGISIDMTGLKRAETEELEAKARLAATLESMTDAVSVTDAEGRLVDFNPAFVTFHRCGSREECVDTLDRFAELYGIFLPDGQAAPQELWPVALALAGETGTNVEYGVQRRDTEEMWVASYSFAPIRGAQGAIIGTVSVGRDITEERRGMERLGQLEQLVEAQAALARSEQQLSTIAENITDVIWTMDLDRPGFVWITPSIEALLGYTAEETRALGLDVLLTPESLERVQAIVAGALGSDGVGDAVGLRITEADQVRKDGSVVATEVTTRFLPTPDGRRHVVLGITRDITERKRAAEALRASEDRYRTLFEQAPDGITITDPAGLYLDINENACRMWGYTREEMIGMHVSQMVSAEQLTAAGAALDRIRAGESYVGVWDFVRKDGSVFAGDLHAIGMPDGTLVGVVRDMSDRKRAEELLRESEEKYRSVVERANDGIVIVQDGHIALANEAMANMSGFPLESLIGMEDSSQWSDRVARRLAGEDVPSTYETVLARRDGMSCTVEVSAAVITFNGAPADLVVMRDITERKRAEQELLELATSLEQTVFERTRQLAETVEALTEASEAKSRFLRSMSHELRTPLNSVIGFSTLLAEGIPGPVNEEQSRQIAMIRGSGEHLLALIDDILDLSRLEAGKEEVSLKAFDVEELLSELLASVGPLARDRGLELTLDVETPDVSLFSDERKVRQILLNLLSNAIKFTDTGGVVLRAIRPEPGWLALEVVDTGHGIAPEDQARLFGEFERGPQAVGDAEGTGLGLAISKQLADLLGGSLVVSSALGAGSTFTLTLPCPPGGG